ncbi:Transposase [Pseudomonas antarctica]|uniref:Transposase n=1 Tax=Pseudomonas antarctica TaxID=219572 RepID=A0A1H0BP50_9PSED|nr:transposase domain-containing protein [Pseudomonas antarctica]KAF2406566.1 transposase [Pseudomonas antarctica]SDN47352.1 Transposase [Pseudomonas antarctica]
MRQRSSYPKPFKAQVVQECLQPGATISSVAIHHGINANVSLIQSARLNGHDPHTYLKDVLTRLPTQRASDITALLPHRWAPI